MKIKITDRTRLKFATRVVTFLCLLSGYAVYTKQETVAATAIAGVLTITTGYIYGESTRPSGNQESNSNNNVG